MTELVDIATSLVERLLERGATSVQVEGAETRGYSVTSREFKLETFERSQEHGLTVTVYQDHKTASVTLSDFNAQAVAVDKAMALLNYAESDPCAGLPDFNDVAFNFPRLDLYYPWGLTEAEAIEMSIACEREACNLDARIKQSEGVSITNFNAKTVLVNSHGFVGQYQTSTQSLVASLIAEQGGEAQVAAEYQLSRHAGRDILPLVLAKAAAEKVIAKLNPRKVPTQEVPVVFSPPMARRVLGGFLAAIYGSSIYRGTSYLVDMLGEPVVHSALSFEQFPHVADWFGTEPFDAEGVRTRQQLFVSQGELNSYILDTYSARKLGLKTTGSAGGFQNIVVHDDRGLQENVFADFDKALLVTKMMGQGVNLTTGDYSQAVSGFWVEKGEIQFPVHEVTIAGNLRDMLKNVVALGDDVDHRGKVHVGSMAIAAMMVGGA